MLPGSVAGHRKSRFSTTEWARTAFPHVREDKEQDIGFSDALVAIREAASLWAYRATVELEAAARFDRLAETAQREGAEPIVVELARGAGDDERRHHERCVELVEHLGGRWSAPLRITAQPVRSGLGSARADLLYELVAMSCVTETLSAALLMEMRAAAADDLVRDVIHEVLVDEVDHSRLGWAHLAAESRRCSVGFLGDRLPAMLADTVAEELFGPDADASPELDGLGALSRGTRKAVFAATMLDVVFPGLRRFGIDTGAGERWLDERL